MTSLSSPTPSPELRIACLCAEWCGTCRDVRPVLEAACAGVPLRWIDIEDEAELVGDVDVETFPTLLVTRGRDVLFFGPVLPQRETVGRLVQAWQGGGSPALQSLDSGVRRLATLVS